MQRQSDVCCRCGAPARLLRPDNDKDATPVMICTLCNMPCDSCQCRVAILKDENFDDTFEPCLMV